VESRCGLLCSACEYREQMNCGGCIAIVKPFWGYVFPVKSCCDTNSQSTVCFVVFALLARRSSTTPSLRIAKGRDGQEDLVSRRSGRPGATLAYD